MFYTTVSRRRLTHHSWCLRPVRVSISSPSGALHPSMEAPSVTHLLPCVVIDVLQLPRSLRHVTGGRRGAVDKSQVTVTKAGQRDVPVGLLRTRNTLNTIADSDGPASLTKARNAWLPRIVTGVSFLTAAVISCQRCQLVGFLAANYYKTGQPF
jgi:hypothetical protein